jgi:hypothetical protein
MLRLSALATLLLAPVALASDPSLRSWRPDTAVFTRAARMVGFFEVMRGDGLRPTDGAAAGVFVWAEKNKRYAVYAPAGGRVNLKIPAGDWRVKFYNPRTGEWGKKFDEKADDSGLTLKFTADGDWAALLVRD